MKMEKNKNPHMLGHFNLQEYPKRLQDKYNGCGWCWVLDDNGLIKDWGYAPDDIRFLGQDEDYNQYDWDIVRSVLHPKALTAKASCWQLCIFDI